MAAEPAVLFLDEALSGLEEVREGELVRTLIEEPSTSILVYIGHRRSIQVHCTRDQATPPCGSTIDCTRSNGVLGRRGDGAGHPELLRQLCDFGLGFSPTRHGAPPSWGAMRELARHSSRVDVLVRDPRSCENLSRDSGRSCRIRSPRAAQTASFWDLDLRLIRWIPPAWSPAVSFLRALSPSLAYPLEGAKLSAEYKQMSE